jgi:hypothetical protein
MKPLKGDNETAVSTDYKPASSKFTGQIESVRIAVAPARPLIRRAAKKNTARWRQRT